MEIFFMLLQKLVIFVVCSIVFFSPTQCSQVAQTIISISFCNPESIAFAAISPNCSRYAITKKGATQLSVYETSTHTLLNTISTGTTKAETTGALHFID